MAEFLLTVDKIYHNSILLVYYWYTGEKIPLLEAPDRDDH